ncbi:NAD(P)-binding protein [Leucogyrophana mollusca]|uniref:NAD(P)-binding protein n=1 Tax=Leucogyrophana mollusca TaxID=85980 RepID=A0ACB8BAP4_9AGAM|nr:NAD(P)-binding protein [Leucogyrophana mollusca]
MPDKRARVALVTGAAQGIGRAIALRLADDGLDVAIAGLPARTPELGALAEEIRIKGRRALPLIADVTVEEQVNEMVQQAASQLGGLDVLVANAGRNVIGSLIDLPLSKLDDLFNVNMKGTLLCYRAAGKFMIEQGRGGRIIGACSIAGKKGNMALNGAYCASKAAVRSLTQTLACELGKYGITVNAYAPGPIDTELMRTATDEAARQHGISDGATLMKQFMAQAPLSRVGTPEDVVGLVSFLASSDSSYMTGQTLTIDGGLTMD